MSKSNDASNEPTKLTIVPNMPIAEMLCSELRQNGIEAFAKGTSPWGGTSAGSASLGAAFPAEIWVRLADVVRARHFLPG